MFCCRYANTCFELGGEWIEWNNLYKEVDFFHVERQHIADFNSKWSMCQKWKREELEADAGAGDGAGAPEAAAGAVDGAVAAANVAAGSAAGGGAGAPQGATGGGAAQPNAKGAAKAKGRSKAAAKGKVARQGAGGDTAAEGGSPDTTPRTKSELDKLLTQAGRVKQKYHSIASIALTLVTTIEQEGPESEGPWAAMQSPALLGKLKSALQQLTGAVSSIGHKILTEEIAKLKAPLKKELGDAKFVDEVRSFNELMPHIEAVCVEHEKLIEGQRAMAQAGQSTRQKFQKSRSKIFA